jgi:periplasmic protein CpxP/Spy
MPIRADRLLRAKNHNRLKGNIEPMKQFIRIHKLTATLMMALVLAVSTVSAQSTGTDPADSGKQGHFHGERFRMHHGRHHGDHMNFFGKLNLTDAQKAQIKQLHESRSETISPLLQQIRSKQQEIRQSTQGGTFNEAVVTQKMTEIAVLKAKLMGERFKMHQDVMALLTPEQKSELDKSREEFKQKREEFKKKREQFKQKTKGGQDA